MVFGLVGVVLTMAALAFALVRFTWSLSARDPHVGRTEDVAVDVG
jgi:hypothetical protein